MSTHRPRVIPCLTVHRGGLVKTTRFGNPRYVGDPINAIRILSEKEVDELILLDISATRDGQRPDFDLIARCASECFMPLCYGGAVASLEDAERILTIGAEKIAVQSAALRDPELVERLAVRFGRQSVVFSLDIERGRFGAYRTFASATRQRLRSSWQSSLKEIVARGAGEVLLSAVDRDGTLSGMDLPLIRQAAMQCNVPLIAAGGARNLSDIGSALQVGAAGVAVGAAFVFHGPHNAVLITYPTPEAIAGLRTRRE